MTNSNTKSSKSKPSKPYAGFPLTVHNSGQWSKKIRGRTFYFGTWDDPEAALDRFNREWPYLSKGQEVPAVDVSEGCKLKQLCNQFLESKEAKMNAGELSPRTFRDYFYSCERLIEQFGKERRVDDLRPDDFRSFRTVLAKRYNVVSLKNEINRVRVIFNYAHENRLIEKPVSYGSNFDRPSAKALRKSKNEGGAKLYTRDEVLGILDQADPVMKAMCMLGLNCGFGNSDVASLPEKAIDFENGWIEFPRPKTEIHRKIPLWKETIEALQEAIDVKPKAKNSEDDKLCFLTQKQGLPWVRVSGKSDGSGHLVAIDAVSGEFRKILDRLKINGRRGLGFYCFRHVFATIGGESRDPDAVKSLMGHSDNSMTANYTHHISDERLQAVVDVVHAWIWPVDES